jgi:hypothetical protein
MEEHEKILGFIYLASVTVGCLSYAVTWRRVMVKFEKGGCEALSASELRTLDIYSDIMRVMIAIYSKAFTVCVPSMVIYHIAFEKLSACSASSALYILSTGAFVATASIPIITYLALSFCPDKDYDRSPKIALWAIPLIIFGATLASSMHFREKFCDESKLGVIEND